MLWLRRNNAILKIDRERLAIEPTNQKARLNAALPQLTRKIWLKIRACRGYRP